uniref:TRAF3-interacting JNK-activating modulator n=1 Tax=Pelusios castaneus TaxID=367368 RepID=A0A8C8SKP6_9SAUR
MVILQELLSTLLQASEKSWKGQLNEEKLKGELRALKNQLYTCSQSYSKDSVTRILMEMEDQKQTYEQKAREAVQKLLEEKLQAEQELQVTQRTLTVTENNCTLWKEHYDTLKADWSETVSRHTELENKLYVLQNELQWADTQNDQLQQALHNLERERTDLYSRIEALQLDNKLKMERVSAMEGTVFAKGSTGSVMSEVTQ